MPNFALDKAGCHICILVIHGSKIADVPLSLGQGAKRLG